MPLEMFSLFQGHFAKKKRLIWVSRFPSESSLYRHLLLFGQSSRCTPWHNVWHMGIKGENATALQQNTKYFSSFQITAQVNTEVNMIHSLRNIQIAHFPNSHQSRMKLFYLVTTKLVTSPWHVALKLENCDKELNEKQVWNPKKVNTHFPNRILTFSSKT